MLFDRHGTEYATRYLFGMLEDSLRLSAASDWLIEE
jgi:hypothetical protein